VTRIPGDLDRPDQFLFGLTARQLLIVAPAFAIIALVAWLMTTVLQLPLALTMPVLAILSGLAISTTLVKADGLSPDRLAGAFFQYIRAPRRLVWAPEGTPPLPRRLRGLQRRNKARHSLGQFEEPWKGFRDGDVDLGDACVRLLAVSSLDLQLRSDKETRVLTEGFGRLLNALDDSLCVIVRGEPIDLEEAAVTAELAGASQDNGAISAFGADHAAFLRSISGGLRRQVYIVVRGADGAQLDARCEEILTLLVPFGIRAARLGKEETVGLLARATGGGVPGSGQAAPGETVRGGVADAISP
jgi:hypothetical protein